MKLAIGSTNQAKIEALEEIIQGYPTLAGATICPYAIPSGVSEQPLSLEEMIQGAKNRANGAFLVCGDCKYAFGIESGLFDAPGTKTKFLESTVCAIYDGSEYHIGLSCGFEIPQQLLDLILGQKMDLTQACIEAGVSSNPKLGAAQGLIGILTQGRMNRKEYTKQGIATALIQLENAPLYAAIQQK